MHEFDRLRRDLSEMSRTRSRASQATRRTIRPSSHVRRPSTAGKDDEESQVGEVVSDDKEEDDFQLDVFTREGHFEKRKDGSLAKKVGVVFKNLTVKDIGVSTTFVKTLPDAVLGTFGPDLY